MSLCRPRRTEASQRFTNTSVSSHSSNATTTTTLPRPYATHVGLEATLSDSKKKYGDKVNALLSAWEHVTNFIPGATPEATQSLIEWAHKHTLKLVLRGEWPKLSPATKTHLSVTLQRCASHLVQHPAALRCTALIALVHNPWTHPALDSILNGQPDSEHEEEFCCSEKGELLTMRLKILCEDRCEDIAVNLAAACIRSLRRSDRLRSLSDPHQIHYMIDVYIVLLYKLKRTQDIFAQLKLMDLNDGLELVQRLSGEKPTKYGTARVWRNSIKAAELVAQYLVTAGMVRPVSETGANILEQIFNSWALLHSKLKDITPTLSGMIRKLIEPAESAQHIYIFCAVLIKHFGDSIKPLVIELYIRALTTDMNELESQKAKSDKEKVRETAKRLSTQFLKLADVVGSNIGIARECVLTAFSLHPTRACYDRIKDIAIACGKTKQDDGSLNDVVENEKLPNTSTNDHSTTSITKSEKTVSERGGISISRNGSILESLSSSSSATTTNTTTNNTSITTTNTATANTTATTSIISTSTSSSIPTTYSSSSLVATIASSSLTSTIMTIAAPTPVTKKAIDFQNGKVSKTFERTDQLLKSMLTASRKNDNVPLNDKCLLHPKRSSTSDGPLGELCFNCGEFTGDETTNSKSPEACTTAENVERTLDALILIKGEAVTGSANYDEKSVPNQVLDAEKLGLSPQLCDDLSVVLSSPRYHMLSWVLDWKELNNLCERYLENAEEMRNTNKELKYLNIDYSQFKDWPSEDDTKDVFFGIEKGYEQWADLPSDGSEQFGSFQPAGGYKRSSTRRSLDDTTTTDSDSGSVLRVRRTGRQRKVHRLESSESDYDSAERKPKHFRNRASSVSDSDSNTQDSQTDSLGSDGCRLETKKKTSKSSNKEISKKRVKPSKLTVDSVSHFHMLVNENVRHASSHEDASGSDVSTNDIITLFSADMDESKRETIKGSAYTAAAPLIITERRSDPAVLKSLRMFRPQNAKKPTRIAQILQKNLLNKSKDNKLNEESSSVAKFAPMLSTLNLSPKIVLTRADEIDRKLVRSKKKQRLSTGDITSELINIQKTMPFSPNKNVMTTFQKQKNCTGNNSSKTDLVGTVDSRDLSSVKSNLGKNKFDILAKAVRDSDILAKNVPGLNSLDMMVPPRVRSTVNVVQLSRNIPQSPNSGSTNSGNTPPRPNRTPSVAGSIQLPGTPSSGGHDSGVGMSPAGQTPPPRSSALPDIGEEANQPPDTSSTTPTNTIHFESDTTPRTAMRRGSQHQSPKKSPSPCSAATTTTTITTTTTTSSSSSPSSTVVPSSSIGSEQLQIVCKPDGTYQLASVNPNVLTNQRNVLTLQNLDDGNVGNFSRQTQRNTEGTNNSSNRNTYDRLSSVKVSSQPGQNTGLPKFQQAFGRTIYTLSTETSSGTVTTTESLVQSASTQKTTNLSKAVQTSVPNAQQTNSATGINVQSITNIPNLQLSAGRQILNIVQSSSANANTGTNLNTNQTLTQLVQSVQNASPGVIYTHKIPVTISTTNPSQLNIIPTISHANSIPTGRTPVVKLNIIRTAAPLRPQNLTGTIQAVLTTPRLQQQTQQNVRTDNLLSSPIEVPNQVSSTTLEQLREFESVLEQVKERSTIQPQSHQSLSSTTTTTVQTQTTTQSNKQQQQQQQKQQTSQQSQQQQVSVSALAQQLLMPTQSSSNNEFSGNGNNVTFQQDVFPQKVSLAYVSQNAASGAVKVSNSTPVVVVTSYCQPVASPALSVTSQSSSSPCVTPAPAPIPSSGKTPSTPPSSKTSKKSSSKTVKTSATNTSKASPIPKPQQKPQEDEQTAQRIYAILDEYAEQLRNSPDLNNKPAPRRRSNPPTNPSQSSKRKKSSSSKTKPQTSELSPSADDLGRTMGSEDSSSGVVHVQDSPASFVTTEEPSTNVTNTNDTNAEIRNLTSDSSDGVELNVKRRNLIFAEPGAGQPRAVIVQEALQTSSVSVSEAIASVTGKVGSTAVLVPGTNYILPMNLMKSGQQFTIVSSGSKFLTTMPATVRATGNTGVSNTLVLQSFLNQAGKIISQPTQVKQVKIPTLQTLSGNQSLNTTQNTVQNASVVIPQTATSNQFSGESVNEKNNIISDINASKSDVTASVAGSTESATSTIVVNKTNPTIGLIQRNLNEISENQQICSVITSNPNLALQSTRLFNSSMHKITTPTGLKTENVVCLTPGTISHSTEKKSSQDNQTHNEKPVSIQTAATIALAFAAQSTDPLINGSQQQQKDIKESSSDIISDAKIISPKTVKRKIEDAVSMQEIVPRNLISTNSVVCSNIVTSLQNNTKIDSMSTIASSNKDSSNIENSTQYLVTGGPSSSDSQESPVQQSSESVDVSCKIGNGLLYGNARLQEAWEPEGKVSPDTPWRYVPTSTNPLGIEPLKVYSRENDNSDNVQSVLQIINKGQGIEMASGQVYQTNTKKYFMNHTLEPFQQYSNKSIMKSQLHQRLDRELLQQKMEKKTAALERELRLQKSLSEECEDLGVDEPSTSDLFPEADLLFDTNHSPSFDHSSQDASCSQSLGMKSYSSSYFRPLDSSSGSRDASPVADFKLNERRKNATQRTRSLKDTSKRRKGDKAIELQSENPAKHMRFTLENLSQDEEGSNSNSDMSRLSPTHLPLLENDSSKDINRIKMDSRNGSKEGSPSSVSSIPSNIKLDMDLDSESLPPSINVNNTSAASSGDESLTLLGGSTADVTIPSPLSPIAGPLLSTHKYTYTNKKRIPSKLTRMDYLSWESPMSERTRTSSDEEDSSISESISSQPEDNALTNGLDDAVQQTLKSTSADRRCTYLKKKDKLQVNARVVLNRADHKPGTLSKRIKPSESINDNVVLSSDKTSELSEDETGNLTSLTEPDCRARRSSLRGHVKKGCACCNGSPERPKKKTVKSVDHRLKKRLSSKQAAKKR
ncbi:serine-rich adhesin for platelets-like isoform X1 [Vespa velutina]|uniref:serine-rich adhesin for platelets-like isoform X1 n=1 Tax=Vespa velutina TaxID=202808 RepID=UPI001FB37BED|nr:serine-rich adhesin for platelets-like isoform X1 [Vespa velutina]